jgi:hypothetical protein
VSGVAAAVCLLVAVLFERRRRGHNAPKTSFYESPTYTPTAPPAPPTPPVHAWPPAGPVDEPVWEDVSAPTVSAPTVSGWPVEVSEPETDVVGPEAEVAEHVAEVAEHEGDVVAPEVEPEVETFQPEAEVAEPELQVFDSEVAADVVAREAQGSGHEQEHENEPESVVEVPQQPAFARDNWFGTFAPPAPAEPVVDVEAGRERDPEADTDEYDPVSQTVEVERDSVVELPADGDQPDAGTRIRRLPPARLRRFMGTGATVLVIGLVLGAGVLVSGATADSSSDPTTVPDAVGTTVADLTTTDSTVADTTTTDTTTTDTTTTDTTTTDTTTTSTDPTTTTDTTTTDTTTTDTTPTTTTDTTPVPPPPPTDTTPAPDPSASTPPAPAAPTVDQTPAVTPPTTSTPSGPTHTPKPKVKTKPRPTHHAPAKPAKATHHTTVGSDAPSTDAPPVVTLASGGNPVGSILSNNAIPAVDASLLPTPAQVSFYVQAAKPLSPLPRLGRIDHAVAQRLVTAGRRGHVGWTVLAAVSRIESNFGVRSGLVAGQGLPTTPSGDGLAALAAFLKDHGAVPNPLTPARSRKALTAYFGSGRKADRAIALAALYGALGPFGMQHGVRAETARLQRRVLADHRVHLTKSGRGDIRHGRVDPRVLVTLEYLANSFHKIGISDLVSGGQIFSRSGSVSAHLYGRAADVSSLHGKPVRGHQGPGTLTEQAIRKLLLLPRSLRPRQVISLMDVDGPTGNRGSFALPDHYNRIQIDY